MINIFKSILLLAIALSQGPATHATTLSIRKLPAIDTQHFKINLTEYTIANSDGSKNNTQTVGGGAFVLVDGTIYHATSSGLFWGINPKTKAVTENILPPLDLGHANFDGSKNITYHETYPRVCGITYNNGTFYVTYNKYYKKPDRVRFEIAQIKQKTTKWTTIYTSPFLDTPYYTIGDGGKMLVADNYLYFTLGDYSLDRQNNLPSDYAPQNTNLPWGKVNRINLKDFSHSIYSIGHRNQQGLVQLNNGLILATEHGPRGGDEINIIEQGKNYGWPYFSLGSKYTEHQQINFTPKNKQPPHPIKFENPIYAFIPSVAPTQLIEVSNFDSAWNGNLLMGSLRATSLYRIGLANKTVMYVEPIQIGQRIRDIKQLNNSIFLLTDNNQLIEITKDQTSTP